MVEAAEIADASGTRKTFRVCIQILRFLPSRPHGFNSFTGLQRVRDKLMADLQELNKSKPRGKEDDALVATITRLEPAYTVARDDLVCFFYHFPLHCE